MCYIADTLNSLYAFSFRGIVYGSAISHAMSRVDVYEMRQKTCFLCPTMSCSLRWQSWSLASYIMGGGVDDSYI